MTKSVSDLRRTSLAVLLAAVGSMLALLVPGAEASPTASCAWTNVVDGPDYYAIELVPTGRVSGTRDATGNAEVLHRSGPFAIAVAPDGAYAQRLRIVIGGIAPRDDGVLAVWLTTPELDRVQHVGNLSGSGALEGDVAWNKFLVVVSFETSEETVGDRWSGPIVMRGSSRSGRMHTMAGHGPFEGEPCAKYGY